MAWLVESDLVIAECTHPSLGVGYELAYAEKLGKPCYLFYRDQEVTLSAMLTGNSAIPLSVSTSAVDSSSAICSLVPPTTSPSAIRESSHGKTPPTRCSTHIASRRAGELLPPIVSDIYP